MKKWAFAITVAFFAIVSVAAAAVALTDEGGSAAPVARDADNRGESGADGSAGDCATPPCEDVGGGAAGICIEGTVDCVDTPVEDPAGDACILIAPPPPECTDPDAPVTNEPSQPGTSDPGGAGSEPGQACTMEYPNECTATAAAVADLAAHLDIEEPAVTVVGVEAVEWPNACLGVEQPDVACAEIITPGFRIFLEANGQKYEYHTDGGSRAELVE